MGLVVSGLLFGCAKASSDDCPYLSAKYSFTGKAVEVKYNCKLGITENNFLIPPQEIAEFGVETVFAAWVTRTALDAYCPQGDNVSVKFTGFDFYTGEYVIEFMHKPEYCYNGFYDDFTHKVYDKNGRKD